jgi:hypothetical protein
MKGASTVDKEQPEEFGHRLLKAGVEKTDELGMKFCAWTKTNTAMARGCLLRSRTRLTAAVNDNKGMTYKPAGLGRLRQPYPEGILVGVAP